MSGFNESLAARIAQVAAQDALATYSAAPLKLISDQNLLIAKLLQDNFKKPSVFECQNFYSAIETYQHLGYADYISNWYSLIFSPITIAVFNIKDADRVKINFQYFGAGTPVNSFNLIGFALTPLTSRGTIIPLNQFGILNCPYMASTSENFATISEEVPTSGNQYMHLFGLVAGSDLFSTEATEGQAIGALSLALIK